MSDRFTTNGAFSWSELLTSDVEGAKKFYGDLLGWEIEDMPMEGMDYTVVKAGGEEVGGIMAMPPQAPEGMPPHWGTYVTVTDVDAVARKAPELGGRVLLPPTDIPGVGRFSVIQDPQGAVLSVITYTFQAVGK
ncbi:VOC family protein [Desulfonatronum lacustre]|uniref:VOC family protein n=1 Tax=Desulfonatronum lacustre TaxID=66849 RepID=UPI00048EF1B0|nr:VOC family protein [Desulfonatronum lacustre]